MKKISTIIILSSLIFLLVLSIRYDKVWSKEPNKLYKVSINNGKFILCEKQVTSYFVNAINCSNGMSYYNQPLAIAELP